MAFFEGKRIGLAVCGGIAAFKSAELASLLIKKKCQVFPIMTRMATEFLGPLTLEALTGQAVLISGSDSRTPGGMDHIKLVKSLDALVIAPLTANTCSKLANGLADQFLGSAYLAFRGPKLACPAMNTAMLEHPATVRNLKTLEADGVTLCLGDPGVLACGDVGMGRMAEPSVIMDYLEQLVSPDIPFFKGRKVLINAGPTMEDLDPVRFLTNRSSGKMGLALARALRNSGAEVTLVHGPINIPLPRNIHCIQVRSAAEMAKTCMQYFPESELTILTAAVADFTPVPQKLKLKKKNFSGKLELLPTQDILKTMGIQKGKTQILVGFAAETHDEAHFAKNKLNEKNADLIFCNTVGGEQYGFGSDENKTTAFLRDGQKIEMQPCFKEDLAIEMVHLLSRLFFEEPRTEKPDRS